MSCTHPAGFLPWQKHRVYPDFADACQEAYERSQRSFRAIAVIAAPGGFQVGTQRDTGRLPLALYRNGREVLGQEELALFQFGRVREER